MRQPIHFWKGLFELYNFDFERFRRNRSCRARKDLSKNVWVVALIAVYRFRDKRKKHRRANNFYVFPPLETPYLRNENSPWTEYMKGSVYMLCSYATVLFNTY